MKSVLLIGAQYGSPEDANGICLKNLAVEFAKRGYAVYVISDASGGTDNVYSDNGIEVHALKEAWYTRYSKKKRNRYAQKCLFPIVSALRRVFLIPLYPNVSPIRSRRVFRTAKNLVQRQRIDLVLSTYRPFESIYTAIKLKKLFQDQLFVCCGHLDLLTNPNRKEGIVRKHQETRAKLALSQELRLVDRIILPENKRNTSTGDSKILFAGFPVYASSEEQEYTDFCFARDSYNIAYVGTLNMSNRDPSYVCNFFAQLQKKTGRPIVLHIWGKLEPGVPEIIQQFPFVHYHGTVASQYVMSILRKADCLLNITNANSFNMLPSKIFQMFASQRPIINFVKNDADCSLPYFQRYGYELRIFENKPAADQLDRAAAFFDNTENQTIPFPAELVMANTPEYYADLLDIAHTPVDIVKES